MRRGCPDVARTCRSGVMHAITEQESRELTAEEVEVVVGGMSAVVRIGEFRNDNHCGRNWGIRSAQALAARLSAPKRLDHDGQPNWCSTHRALARETARGRR